MSRITYVVPKKSVTVTFKGEQSAPAQSVLAEHVMVKSDVFIGNRELKPTGTSKVCANTISRYDWEQKFYFGHLVAANTEYIAYVLKGLNSSVCIRVMHRTSHAKVLIKGFPSTINDISFASPVLDMLAGVDVHGNIYIWEIKQDTQNQELKYHVVFTLKSGEKTSHQNNRIIWQPQMDFLDETDNGGPPPSPLFVVTRGAVASVFDPDLLQQVFEDQQELYLDEISQHYIRIEEHQDIITDCSISPDAAILATVSSDGYLKCFQLKFEDSSCSYRTLQNFRPHEEKRLSSLHFCDDRLNPGSNDSFWRFFVTGAENNSEIKLWCASSWKLLQTINFNTTALDNPMKAEIDPTGSFIVLSNVMREVLYVLTIRKYQNGDREGYAVFSDCTEYTLASPVLSFVIWDTIMYTEEDDELTNSSNHTLKLTSIHTKSLQDLEVKVDLDNFSPSRNLVSTTEADSSQPNVMDVESLEALSLADSASQRSGNYDLMNEDELLRPNSFDRNIQQPDEWTSNEGAAKSAPGDWEEDLHRSSDRETLTAVSSVETSLEYSQKSSDRRLNSVPRKSASPINKEVMDIFRQHEAASLQQPLISFAQDSPRESRMTDSSNERSLRESLPMTRINGDERSPRANANLGDERSPRANANLESAISGSGDATELRRTLAQILENQKRLESQLAQLAANKQSDVNLKGLIAAQVKSEIKSQVIPAIQETMKPFQDNLNRTVSEKLTCTDSVVKEQIKKMMSSKQVVETLGKSAAAAMDNSVTTHSRELFEKTLAPQITRSLENSVRQVNVVFKEGTNEYLRAVESQISSRDGGSRVESQLVKMQAANADMQNKIPRLVREAVQEQMKDVQNELQKSMEASQRQLSGEIRLAMTEQQKLIQSSFRFMSRNAAATPLPEGGQSNHVDVKVVVEDHLKRGNFDRAFETALSATDVHLVLHVCELVGDQFEKPTFQITYPNILAMLQQLSVNLINCQRIELRLQFLEYCLGKLEPSELVRYPKFDRALGTVQKELERYMQGKGRKDPFFHKAKLLALDARELIAQTQGEN